MTLKDDKIRAAQQLLTEALALNDPVTSTGLILPVKAGQNPQTAIDAAIPGDVVELEAGATFVGHFRLHGVNGQAVGVRSAGSYPGNRVTPLLGSAFAKVRAPADGGPAFLTDPGTQGWILSCLELPGNPGGYGDVIQLGDGSRAQAKLEDIPSRFILDRLYLHGDPRLGQKRGVALNCGTALIALCYMSDIHAPGQDSQAICGWNGSGQHSIVNNYLEAAGENILYGGNPATVPGLVPNDITIEDNLIMTPASYRGKGWNVKNLFELKSATNVRVRRNTFDGSWAEAQSGFAIQLTPRNEDGSAPWSTVEDVLIENNDFKNIAAGINFLGTDERPDMSSGRMRRVNVLTNRFVNVDPSVFSSPGTPASDKVFLVQGGPEDVRIDGNTIQGGNIGSILYFVGVPKALRMKFTNNTYPSSTYGAVFGGGSSAGGPPEAPHAWVDYTQDGTIGGNTQT